MARYKVLTGLTYGNKTVEAGDIVDDIPSKSIKWLREQNLIEQVDAKGNVTEPVAADQDDDEED